MDRLTIPKVGLSVKWVYHTAQNMTDTTRVICVTAAFTSIYHLLNEIIFYVCVLRVAPLYSRVYVDENRLRYPCQRHILYLKRPHTLITD